MAKKTFVVQVDVRKDIPSLGDIIANRAYTIDGVENAQAVEVDALERGGGDSFGEVEMVDDWRDTLLERLGRAIDGFIDGWRGY